MYEKTKDGSIRLISANYSNEVLNDSGTDLIKVQIKLPENVENYFAKAMLLEEIKNIIPITDEIIFD